MPSDGEERAGIAEAAPGDATEAPEHPLDPAEAEASEHPDSFDPGPETGYLRKGPRSHELPVEVGAAPFDPGPEVGVDGRRAKRAARRQEKAERKRREHRERIEREHEERAAAEREQSESAEHEAAERERREVEAAAAAKHAERESREAERERRERAEAAEREQAAQTKAEQRRSKAERRERAESDKKAQKQRARAEREAKQREQKLQKQRERARREEDARAERKRAEGERRKQARKPARPRPPADPHAAKASHHLVHPHRGPRLATPDAKQASLRRPTAKVVAALAGVAAVALGAGALLGLPLPLVGDDAEPPPAPGASTVSLAELGSGTPTGLTKGPYHPVVIEDPNYGEGPAKFHADRGGRKHEGQDVFARPGTPLVAVRDGVVVDGGGGQSFYSTGGGNTLVIYSPFDDRSYVYLHMLKPALVKKGDEVKAGQLVGQLGCTGSCDGPHLHFEVRLGRAVYGPQKKAIDPLPLLKQWPVRPVGGK